MENKKTFGEYICRRRKELGLTQKEFAQRLFVTESAVSKWERGLSYPDVTLLRDICAVLGVSEHELLTASEDTEGRRAELLARKYLALTRNFRLAQYIFYGLILLCAIVNLSVDRCLSWFFIALPRGACASLTLLPALVEERRGAWDRELHAVGGADPGPPASTPAGLVPGGGDGDAAGPVGVLLPVALRSLPLPPCGRTGKPCCTLPPSWRCCSCSWPSAPGMPTPPGSLWPLSA